MGVANTHEHMHPNRIKGTLTVLCNVYALMKCKHHSGDIYKGDGVASSRPISLLAIVVRGPSKNNEHGVLAVSGEEGTRK